MRVYVNLKQIGKKRNSIEKKEYFIHENVWDIKSFIAAIVRNEVKEFNQKAEGLKLIDYLTTDDIEDHSWVGKISFQNDYNSKKQDLAKALENAYQSYIDEIYVIFLNGKKLENNLEAKLNLKEDDEFTFVRLTMLSGLMW